MPKVYNIFDDLVSITPEGIMGSCHNFGSSYKSGQKRDTPRVPSPPIGPLLREISINKIWEGKSKHGLDKPIVIKDCQYTGSYNWLDRTDPKIVIPGCPPRWTPPTTTTRLQEDRGQYYRDPNAARYPTHPLEPAVRTVLAENPDISPQDVDIFACTSTMGSLLRCVRGIDKQFRFFVEVIGSTIFFTRHEGSPRELIPDVRGYGHVFPDAYTTWESDVKGSVSHQRLLRYNLGHLNCIIRFECDGYLGTHTEVDASTSTETKLPIDDDFSSLVSGLNVAPRLITNDQALQIDRAGRRVPQTCVYDLKTRATWRPNTVLEEELPRFWVAQIPNFILARHDKGIFDDIKIIDVTKRVEKWQQDSQKELRHLVSVLREVTKAANDLKDKKLEVRCKRIGVLELRRQNDNSHDALPSDLKAIWVGQQQKQIDDIKPEEVAKTIPVASKGRASRNGKVHQSPSYGDDFVEAAPLDYTACSVECSYCGRCSQ